jgi:hypothetical protein
MSGALKIVSAGGGSATLNIGSTAVNYILPLPGDVTTLTDGATITPDFSLNNVFTVTLGGNRAMANPTNPISGQSGSIFIVQDATGGRTLTWGSNWEWPSGSAPTLSTGANAVDRVDFVVRSSTSIQAVFTANYS